MSTALACGNTERGESPPAEAPDDEPDAGPPDSWHSRKFVDVTEQAGIDYEYAPVELLCGGCIPPQVMMGGAAAADYDEDGWVDLFVTRLDAPNILYQNRGDGTFEDVTDRVGLGGTLRSNGAVWADIDNDGDLDLFISIVELTADELGQGRYRLFINDDGKFTDEAVERGVSREGQQVHRGWSAAFGDYDRDGFLDLHLTEWLPRSAIPEGSPVDFNTRLLHNLGGDDPGYFEDTTTMAGVDQADVHPSGVYSFTSAFTDLDGDGWPDLAVAGDFGTSRLFWNNADGTFSDGTRDSNVGTDENGMGIALGDYDRDGDLDWFVSSISCDADCPAARAGTGVGISGNRLYRNEGGRHFTDATDAAGVRDGYWGWGTQFFDYDNDCDLDLILTNGYTFPADIYEQFYQDPMVFWENDGTGEFRERSKQVGLTGTGSGKGLLVFDFDNDGDLDVFVVNNTGPNQLLRNDGGAENGWLEVRLTGTSSNHFGVGARVTVESDGQPPQLRELRSGGQFLGQNGYALHFGLGKLAESPYRLRVTWPSGIEQVVREVEPNQLVDVTEPSDSRP